MRTPLRSQRWLALLPWCAPFLAALPAQAQDAAPLREARLLPWTVQPGQTLLGIAQDALVGDTVWRELARVNRLAPPYRIRPGQVLQVPEPLLRRTPQAVRVLSTVGEVRELRSGQALAVGAEVAEGQSVATGAGGSTVLQMADGSRVKLAPSSVAEVLASRRYPAGLGLPAAQATDATVSAEPGRFAGALRLLQGALEIFATKVLRAKPLEVTTPTAVVGVRGTVFRVGLIDDPAAPAATRASDAASASAARPASRAEVLEGLVQAQTPSQAGASGVGAAVAQGFGVAVDATTRTPQAVPLLAAPDLSSLPPRLTATRLEWRPADGQQRHRVQIAQDADFDRVSVDRLLAAGQALAVDPLPEGTWHVRARRVDVRGIEGLDAQQQLLVRTLPAAPLPQQPASGTRQRASGVALQWQALAEAQGYDLELGSDPGFATTPLVQRAGLPQASAELSALPQGRYWWRVRSRRADGDLSPWSDARAFDLAAPPQQARAELVDGARMLRISWAALADERQQLELASDMLFSQNLVRAERPAAAASSSPSQPIQVQWLLPAPALAGAYFVRHRPVVQGEVPMPWSPVLQVDVPLQAWRLWLWGQPAARQP